MKEYLIDHVENYDNPVFKITQKEDKLVFKLANNIRLVDKHLMIKHRRTGKRILKKIKRSKAELTLKDLSRFAEDGIFDVYVQLNLFKTDYLRKVRFDFQNTAKSLVDRERMRTFSAYQNINYNLSFMCRDVNGLANVTSLTSHEDHVILTGEVECFKDMEIDEAELLIIFNENRREYVGCDFEVADSTVKFHAKLDFDIYEKDFNEVFNITIRLKNKDIILFDDELCCSSLKKSDSIPDKYFTFHAIDQSRNGALFYANEKSNLVLAVVNEKDVKKLIRSEEQLYDFYTSREDEKPLVFFESFNGKAYAGQPKYIYEKMLELNQDERYDFIWSYEGDLDLPGNPLIISRASSHFNKLLRASDFWVTNTDFPKSVKSKDTVYLQTTCGTPFKKIKKDSNNSEIWDYLLCSNDFSAQTYEKSLEYDGTIIKRGLPSNEMFSQDLSAERKSILKRLDISKKVILYAPTDGCDLQLDLKGLCENLSDEYVLIIKPHPFDSNVNINDDFDGFLIELSDWDDINELYIISDILITDCSSAFFDFAHTKRPVIFYTQDLGNVYAHVNEMLLGPVVSESDDLINLIENIENVEEEYKNRYESFYKEFCNSDKNSAKHIIDIVFGGVENEQS